MEFTDHVGILYYNDNNNNNNINNNMIPLSGKTHRSGVQVSKVLLTS